MAAITTADVEQYVGALLDRDLNQCVGQRVESACGQESTSGVDHFFNVTSFACAALACGREVDVALTGHIEAMP
jgi:hypothetical protein